MACGWKGERKVDEVDAEDAEVRGEGSERVEETGDEMAAFVFASFSVPPGAPEAPTAFGTV